MVSYTLKRGVSIVMTEEIEKLLSVICPVYKAFKFPVVITSGNDGKHGAPDSLHYANKAIDLRQNFWNRDLDDTWKRDGRLIIEHLRSEFKARKYPAQIVPESDHVHIEWDERNAT